jgi:HlyD family type I secretion membrane fusion protein
MTKTDETLGWRMPAGRGAVNRSPFGAGLVFAGFAIIVGFSGSFSAWSVMAPIEGAVVAPGIVGVDSTRKTVQHLEGGIIGEILVREGGTVSTGDVVIRLQNTVPASILNELQAQYFEARATEARLIAERDGRETIAFPPELLEKVADLAVQDAILGQQSIHESRWKLMDERLTILERTIGGLESEILGLEGQITSGKIQLTLIDEELDDTLSLYNKQLINKPRLLALQRDKAKLEGAINNFTASVGAARQRIEEARMRKAELQTAAATEVVAQLQEARTRAYELSQQIAAAQDVMGRTVIRAPIDGIVVGLKVHTIGGVIAAGQPLLDIVPSNDTLVVHATIDPLDIDQVEAGLPATVWLSALNRRNHEPIEGVVQMISADRLTDATTGFAYYLARVELQPDALKAKAITIQPGMSAEVMIRTGARTPLDYLTAPIARFLSRALREE